jgi:O-antigen ligase
MNVKNRICGALGHRAGNFRKHAEVLVFFFFLITSLFLGDGKQPFVDVWWALGILLMYGVRCCQRGKLDLSPAPLPVGFVWTALIVYYMVLIPFSDSAGYSITATIRLIEAYLIYVMFVSVSRDQDGATGLFRGGLMLTGIIATLASFVFLARPNLARLLPPMNLLYANYGHNHLAGLLLFIFPVVVSVVEKKRSAISLALLVFFTVGMILTLARGAWIILATYLLFVVWKSRGAQLRLVVLATAACIAAAFLAVAVYSFLPTRLRAGPMVDIFRQMDKPAISSDGRWEYWRQAVEAIKERPIFGSGPGTFYLQSRRLQARPNAWSWFAHSLPLQTMVETGLVGLGLFLIMVVVLWMRALRAKPNNWFLTGPALILFYSLFEFSLNYVSVFLLSIAVVGLVSQKNHTGGLKKFSWTTTMMITLLFLYYLSSIPSLALSLFRNDLAAFYAAPYLDEQTMRAVGSRVAVGGETTRFIALFHAMNPEIHAELGKKTEEKRPREAMTHFYLANKYDPQNLPYYGRYIDNALKTKNNIQVARGLTALIDTLEKQRQVSIAFPKLDDERVYPFLTKESLGCVLDGLTSEPCFSKVFYLLGLPMIKTNQELAIRFLEAARDMSPKYGYFYAELASVYRHEIKNEIKVSEIVTQCLAVVGGPFEHCRSLTKMGLPLPGFYKTKILNIL